MSTSRQLALSSLALFLLFAVGCKAAGIPRPFSASIWPRSKANSVSVESTNYPDGASLNQDVSGAAVIPRPAPTDSISRDSYDVSQIEGNSVSGYPVAPSLTGGQGAPRCTEACCTN